jgi:hypothetical protein
VIDAFAQLGLEARPLAGAPDRGVDLVVDPDGIGAEIHVTQRSLVSDDVVERLLSEDLPPGTALLVVADRVTDAVRRRLTAQGVVARARAVAEHRLGGARSPPA